MQILASLGAAFADKVLTKLNVGVKDKEDNYTG